MKANYTKRNTSELARSVPIIAVGESAGGSVAVRLLMDFPEMILGAWNVCGVLWFTPHQAERYQKSPRHGSFYASVNAVMRAVEARGDEQLMHRVVTTHSRFDGLVPAALTQLDGAQNQETWVPFHPLAIRLALATGAKGVLRKIANGETK